MSSDEGVPLVTFEKAGVIPCPDTPLILLPLLPNEKKGQPPLHLLPGGQVSPDRIVFTSGNSDALHKTSWVASTHVFPSAYPRSHYTSTSPPGAPQPSTDPLRAKASREQEKQLRQRDFEFFEDQVSLSSVESFYPPQSNEEAARIAQTLSSSSQPQFWSSIQRIIPKREHDNPKGKGITLLLSHANGFHKETWEPALESLISRIESQDQVFIEEIWSIDVFHSGESGVMNRPHLSSSVSWMDHARDLLQFLDFYLPMKSPPVDLVDYGPRWPPSILYPTSRGLGRKGRSIIGIGHSFSGACMHLLNMSIGDIMDGQIAIDPIMPSHQSIMEQTVPKEVILARGAIARKDVFENRAAAKDYMSTKGYFQTWSPKVLDLHVKYGLYTVPGFENVADPPVTLCMTKWSEAFTFAQSWQGCFGSREMTRSKFQGWAHLIGTRYLTESPFVTQDTKLTDFYKKLGPRFTSEALDAEHLVVQEHPQEIGVKLADLLCDRISRPETQSTIPKSNL